MSKLKNKKGITLVALIITIIVLLILAMVSIRLVMNGGIIDRAQRGTQAYSDAEVEEKIKTAYGEYQAAKYHNPITMEQALANSGLTGATVSGNDTEGWTITYNGKSYPLSANGTLGEPTEVVSWTKTDDETYTNGSQTLKVGDYVNYDPTDGATVEQMTYTSTAAKSGWNNDQSFDARTYKSAGYRWRVLDVKDGEVRLIADTDIGPGSYTDQNRTTYYLKGQEGYINGIEELNKISSIFGHGTGAESATSITIDDVNAITGYNPEATNPKYAQGDWQEYGNRVTYTRGEGTRFSSRATNGKTFDSNGVLLTFKYYNGTSFVDLTESTTITSTNYPKNYLNNASESGILNSDGTFRTPYEILFGKWEIGSQYSLGRTFRGIREYKYWLASDCVSTGTSEAGWGIRFVRNCGYVGDDTLYTSRDTTFNSDFCVRPIVSLKSSTNLEWNSTTNQWDIK